MAFTINKLAVNSGPNVFYEAEWRQVLETHLTWILTDRTTTVVTPTPQERFKFEGDLYGYLLHANVPSYLHWLIMRMNKMSTPTEFGEHHDQLFVPTDELVQSLLVNYSTVYGRPV